MHRNLGVIERIIVNFRLEIYCYLATGSELQRVINAFGRCLVASHVFELHANACSVISVVYVYVYTEIWQ